VSAEIYLDYAATTPLDPAVAAAMRGCLEHEHGNPSSQHAAGRRARALVDTARAEIAARVGAPAERLFFTSGATEANNLALKGSLLRGGSLARAGARAHLVTSTIEHKSVLDSAHALEESGVAVTYVPPDPLGRVAVDAVERALRDSTTLVSIMHVNNETGVIQPIEPIAAHLEGHAAYFHVDAAQGFGKEIPALRHPRIDLISISGHKLFAPKGVGALVTRRRDGERPPLSPLMFGGGQERGLRPGTLPVHLIVGLGRAAELALAEVDSRAAANRAFLPRAELAAPRLGELLALDDAGFRRLFAGSPIKRIGRDRFVRNVLYAIGNSGDEGLAPEAQRLLDDPSPLVRGAAVWALSRLLDAAAFEVLRAGTSENDPVVQEEWAHPNPERTWEGAS